MRSLRMHELTAVFTVGAFAVFPCTGIFAAAARKHVVARPTVTTWMRRFFGVAFLALAGRLTLTDR